MKILNRDEKQRKKESLLREQEEKMDEQRKEYLTSLKQNSRFQKFVVEGIIKKHIDQLADLNNIKVGDYEEMGKLAFIAMASKKQLEKILGELLN